METRVYSVKATAGQERVVAELLYRKAKKKREAIEKEGGMVASVLYSTGLKGYVLVEADGPGTVEDLARDIPKTRGLLLTEKGNIESAGIITIEEVEKIIKPTPILSKVHRGDLIELISGPFKGERARVAKVDESRNQITVELIEAAVPIPVVVSGEDIKTLEKQSDEDKD
jgi:transcriptional antiterminator NusG